MDSNEDAEFDYYSDYGSKTVSDVYPHHPASQIFPNRPVSEVFRDLPERLADPAFPTVASLGSTDPSSTPFGFFAPAARQVQVPSSCALVSSISIRRDMGRNGIGFANRS